MTVAPSGRVSLLTAGYDKPYALGLAAALMSENVAFDFIGSDYVDHPDLHSSPQVRFLNLRGEERTGAGPVVKSALLASYYGRLMRYAASAESKVFHILWNNRFEMFDRIALLRYYKLLGKKLVFTAHNVNAAKRDGNDSWFNRLTLRQQYQLMDHIFVHTELMRRELISDFAVPESKVSLIPFGINNTVPSTALSRVEARRKLGIAPGQKAMLFFGNIAPYKGLDCLVDAFSQLSKQDQDYRLIICGRLKISQDQWSRIEQVMNRDELRGRILQKIEYVPDEETELYFKAADVLILPYTHIFQSGVLFLGYSFGLPVIAADVGSLREEIVEGKTGFVFPAKDSGALAKTIQKYFDSPLFAEVEQRRPEIRNYANERYSWSKVGTITTRVYSDLFGSQARGVR